MRKTLFCLVCLISTFISKANAEDIKYYNYASNYSEYSVMLPEAPSVRSIWADDEEKVPYLDTIPTEGLVGEEANYNLTDTATNDKFMVEIIHLKADKAYLDSLTQEKMQNLVKSNVKNLDILGNIKTEFTTENGGVTKHASLSGIYADERKKPVYRTEHMLTGIASIFIIRARYNLENEKLNEHFKQLINNIKYLPL